MHMKEIFLLVYSCTPIETNHIRNISYLSFLLLLNIIYILIIFFSFCIKTSILVHFAKRIKVSLHCCWSRATRFHGVLQKMTYTFFFVFCFFYLNFIVHSSSCFVFILALFSSEFTVSSFVPFVTKFHADQEGPPLLVHIVRVSFFVHTLIPLCADSFGLRFWCIQIRSLLISVTSGLAAVCRSLLDRNDVHLL